MTIKYFVNGIRTILPSGIISFWCSLIFLFTGIFPSDSLAQIDVFQESPLVFGAMILSETSGSVTLNPNGGRIANGGIILINASEFHPMILSVEAMYGSTIQIQFSTEQKLFGDNGGEIGLTLNATDPASPFTSLLTPPERTTIYVGGTLSLGNRSTTPPGVYTGSVTLIFIQE